MGTGNISYAVKEAGVYGSQAYHLHVLNVSKSGSHNLLESSEPVQNCTGIVLPSTTGNYTF
jgi:hypothetical protein